jgi:serine/threonine-protein kinase
VSPDADPASDPDPRVHAVWETLVAAGQAQLDPESSLTPPAAGGVGALDGVADDPNRTLPGHVHDAELGPTLVAESGLPALPTEGPRAEVTPTKLLGRGGMGEVHLGVDRVLRREVAVKTARADDSLRTRHALVQEALLTGYLDHPNVIPVHRLGVDAAGRPLMVMKRVEGTSWRELLRQPDHPAWEALPSDHLRANLQILGQVCNAVHYAHSRGILHRDIKPDNVMVGAFGEVYLVDWGAGLRLSERAQAPEGLVGTPAYMAPEMLDEPTGLSERTDVYLLGATLHRVLTGTARHSGDAPFNVIVAAHRSKPVAYGDEVPAELAALCNAATARDPRARPASAEAFRRALEEHLEHQGSVELTRRAREKEAALERELAAPSDPDGRRAASLFAAARFGFEQALLEWPGNGAARDGLQGCLQGGIERALERRRPDEAQALLAGLPEPRPALAERAARLARELATQADAPKRLQALERDLDLRVRGRERALHTGALAALVYGLTLVFAMGFLSGAIRGDNELLLGFHLLVGCILMASVLVTRPWLLSTIVNRRLLHMGVAAWTGILLNNVACWVYPVPLWIALLNVGILMTFFAMQVAAAVDWRMWGAAAIASVGVLSGVAFPRADPLLVHIVFGLLVFAYMVAIWHRDPPGAAEHDAPGPTDAPSPPTG